MTEIEVELRPGLNLTRLPRLVERVCAAEGLTLTLKGTLVKYPGCVHWHFKKDNDRGTLEVTWWPHGRRLWFKIAAGRAGEWMHNHLPHLKHLLQQAVG